MGWTEKVVFDVPGIDPSVAPGFVQWIDSYAASTWLTRARELAGDEAYTAAQAGGWTAQLALARDLRDAVANLYRAVNVRWMCDPVAAETWRAWWGQYEPRDPETKCTSPATGPGAVWTRGAEVRHSAAGIPLSEQQERERGPVATPRAFTELAALAARTRQDLTRPPVVVVPYFLGYRSDARGVSTRDPASGTASARFDGVFTGAACGPVEVPRDHAGWSWDCWRWDDAPLNDLRVLPPLRLCVDYFRAWVRALAARTPWDIVIDARINAVLVNLERTRYWNAEGAADIDEAFYRAIAERNRAKWDTNKSRQLVQTAAAAVCGAATLAGGIGGVACAGIAGAAEFLLGLIPLAVGCFEDGWGQPQPAPMEARISLDTPPAYTVNPAPNPKLEVAWEAHMPIALTIPVKAIRDQVPVQDLGNLPDTVKQTLQLQSQESGGMGAVALGAVAVGAVLLRRRKGR